jgi:hypothetical protein
MADISLRICSMIQSLISTAIGRMGRLRGWMNSQIRRVVESASEAGTTARPDRSESGFPKLAGGANLMH